MRIWYTLRISCCLIVLLVNNVEAKNQVAPLNVQSKEESRFQVEIGSSRIDVQLDSPSLYPISPMLLAWVDRSAQIVSQYYGRFPVDQVNLIISGSASSKVSGGKQYSGKSPTITITAGEHVTPDTLRKDWVMVHEMVHLALADLPQFNRWLGEGLAVYIESVARVQAGDLDEKFVWRGLMEGMPNGLPKAGDKGLDNTPTWGRRYWGGAIFCLVADIEIRRQTNNRHSLRDALRAIVDAGYTTNIDSLLPPILALGDHAVGVDVLLPQYQRMKDDPGTLDLELLWESLGIRVAADSVEFDSSAELAYIREQIMRR